MGILHQRTHVTPPYVADYHCVVAWHLHELVDAFVAGVVASSSGGGASFAAGAFAACVVGALRSLCVVSSACVAYGLFVENVVVVVVDYDDLVAFVGSTSCGNDSVVAGVRCCLERETIAL